MCFFSTHNFNLLSKTESDLDLKCSHVSVLERSKAQTQIKFQFQSESVIGEQSHSLSLKGLRVHSDPHNLPLSPPGLCPLNPTQGFFLVWLTFLKTRYLHNLLGNEGWPLDSDFLFNENLS